MDQNGDLPPVRYHWRFGLVLCATLLLAVAQPLTAGIFGDEGSFDVFFSLLIAAVLLVVLEQPGLRITAASICVVSFFGVWIGHALGGSRGGLLIVGSHLLAACVFGFALYRILRAILVGYISRGAFSARCVDTCCWESSGRCSMRPWRLLRLAHSRNQSHQQRRAAARSIGASSPTSASSLLPRSDMAT